MEVEVEVEVQVLAYGLVPEELVDWHVADVHHVPAAELVAAA